MKAVNVGHVDVVVIGAGPAGAAIGRMLASWGHTVCILSKQSDQSRGLAESLPPSTKKLLEAVGVLHEVDRAGFTRTTGNTVWWASRDPRVEKFDPSGRTYGYQVFRPDFDRVLLESAAAAGAHICVCTARRAYIDPAGATPLVEYEHDVGRESISSRFVIDCSGRAGVIARPYRRFEPNHRTYALVGVWDGPFSSGRSSSSVRTGIAVVADRITVSHEQAHTIVETYEDGWAWSVPLSNSTRHVGTMVDVSSPRVTSGRDLACAYRAEIAKTDRVAQMLDGASLRHVFACDASLYSSEMYAGPSFLLVGDAGSFIDPLSSFGVKKALASAWIGAVAVHTSLTHPDRAQIALEFFSQWERDLYTTHLGRSGEFARTAHDTHPHRFWATRASVEVPDQPSDDASLVRDPDVQRAFEMLRQSADVELAPVDHVRFVQRPVIKGREVVLEPAIPLRAQKASSIRFLDNVDLIALVELSRDHGRVPDLFDAYCRSQAPAALPSVIAGLSFLIAKGMIECR
jgi:flavin-dependent dehydrogenase